MFGGPMPNEMTLFFVLLLKIENTPIWDFKLNQIGWENLKHSFVCSLEPTKIKQKKRKEKKKRTKKSKCAGLIQEFMPLSSSLCLRAQQNIRTEHIAKGWITYFSLLHKTFKHITAKRPNIPGPCSLCMFTYISYCCLRALFLFWKAEGEGLVAKLG